MFFKGPHPLSQTSAFGHIRLPAASSELIAAPLWYKTHCDCRQLLFSPRDRLAHDKEITVIQV